MIPSGLLIKRLELLLERIAVAGERQAAALEEIARHDLAVIPDHPCPYREESHDRPS